MSDSMAVCGCTQTPKLQKKTSMKACDEGQSSNVVNRIIFLPSLCFDAPGDGVPSTQAAPVKRPTRRNLSASLPPHGPATAAPQPGHRVTEEGVLPLQSTPLQKQQPAALAATAMLPSCPPPTYDFNMTFEVPDGEDQTAANSTFVVPAGISEPSGLHPTMAKKSVQSSSRR